jgi:DNA-directed RNA polymerase subunit RPC12/RpoP
MKGILMKHVKLLLFLLIFAAFAPVSAFSQDSVIPLDHSELGTHQRPIVQFNHELHASEIDCLRCHHDYDKFLNNKGGEGQPCSTCHQAAEAKDQMVRLKDAFHLSCTGCHQKMLAQGRPSGPVTCGGCHVKK